MESVPAMHSRQFPRLAAAGGALAVLWIRLAAAEPVFTPVATSAQGLAGDGIALFVPAPLEAGHLPPSLCLVSAPQLAGPLPAGWSEVARFSSDGAHFRAAVPAAPGVDLYGSGEVIGPLRRNGRTIELWNTDNYNYATDEGRRLYQSHPWILGVRADGTAFGVLFDTTWKAELSCTGDITLTTEGPAFPVLVIDRASPAAVLAGLAELTGRMELPPRWALGYNQCKWSYTPAARVREIADGFRARRIPCDVIWLDIDYMDGFRDFTFDPQTFADPAGLNAYLHEHGLTHLADAVENARITVGAAELQVVTAKSYALYFRDRAFEDAVRAVLGKPLRVKIEVGEPGPAPPAALPVASEDEAAARALSHPEVQRFREVFPGGEIRKIRNLKES